METKILNSEDYQAALKRLEIVFDAKAGSSESLEANLLAVIIDDYEKEHYPLEKSS